MSQAFLELPPAGGWLVLIMLIQVGGMCAGLAVAADRPRPGRGPEWRHDQDSWSAAVDRDPRWAWYASRPGP